MSSSTGGDQSVVVLDENAATLLNNNHSTDEDGDKKDKKVLRKKQQKKRQATKHSHQEVEDEDEEVEQVEAVFNPVKTEYVSPPRTEEHEPAHKRIELSPPTTSGKTRITKKHSEKPKQTEITLFSGVPSVPLKSVLETFGTRFASFEILERRLKLVKELCLFNSHVSFFLLGNDGEHSIPLLKRFIICTLHYGIRQTKSVATSVTTTHNHFHTNRTNHDTEPFSSGGHRHPNLHIITNNPFEQHDSSMETDSLTPLSSLSTPSPEFAHLIGHDSRHLHEIANEIEHENSPTLFASLNNIDLALMYCIEACAFEEIGYKDIAYAMFSEAHTILESYLDFYAESPFGKLDEKQEYFRHRLMIAFTYMAYHFVSQTNGCDLGKKYLNTVLKYLVAMNGKKESSNVVQLSQHGSKEFKSSEAWRSEDHLLHIMIASVQAMLIYTQPTTDTESLICFNDLHLSNINSQFLLLSKLQQHVESTDVVEFFLKTLKQKKPDVLNDIVRSPERDEYLYEYVYLHIHAEDEQRIRNIGNETSFWIQHYLTLPSNIADQFCKKCETLQEPVVSYGECLERLKLSKQFFFYVNQISKRFVSSLGSNIALITSLMVLEYLTILLSKLSECQDGTDENTFPKQNTPACVLSSYAIIELTRNDSFPFCTRLILPCIAKALEIQLQELDLLQSTALLNSAFGMSVSQDSLAVDLSVDDLSIITPSEVPNHTITRIRQYLKWGLEAFHVIEQIQGSKREHLYTSLRKVIKNKLSEEELSQRKFSPSFTQAPFSLVPLVVPPMMEAQQIPNLDATPILPLLETYTPTQDDFNSPNDPFMTDDVDSTPTGPPTTDMIK